MPGLRAKLAGAACSESYDVTMQEANPCSCGAIWMLLEP